MADHFNLDLQQNNLKPNSLSYMDLLNYSGNAAIHENFSSTINDNGLMVFSNEHYHSTHPQERHHHQMFPMHNFSDTLYNPITHLAPTSNRSLPLEPDSIRVNSSPQIFSAGFVGDSMTRRNFGYGGGRKRKRKNEKVENEKPREVVHVRARRGQATDSHSLAERLRREKINEKLRSLQDLVPGCYKTMGMAVMLEVIINYVRSLQNQIEFLSMKLSAASLFYDFNSSEMEALDSMQGTDDYEPQVMERLIGEGYGGLPPQFQSAWPL